MAERAVSVTDLLRQHVLDGTLAPGSRLVELNLASEYNVSRAAVRSAITELVYEGLVTREPNHGATVRRIGVQEAIQITEIRGLLEAFVAARAALHADDDQRANLARILDEMKQAVAEDRVVDYSQLNLELHRRLREASKHPVASDLVENLRNRAAGHEFRLATYPGRAVESLGQHAAIIAAVLGGDPDAAATAMRAHLDSVCAQLQRWEPFDRTTHPQLTRMSIRKVARPILEELAEELKETVHLAILDGPIVRYIDAVEGPLTLRVTARVGRTLPAHCTAVGKALLAMLTSEQLLRVYPSERIETMTGRSLSNRAELMAALEQVRERGYAVNVEESEEGVAAVAVAIGRAGGGVMAAISCAAPAPRMERRSPQAVYETLRAAADRIAFAQDG